MIKNMIFERKARGTTIVMSLHEMHQIEEMADRLMMINRGERVLYGPVDEVRQQYAENAVVVSGQGDWSALPGVVSVKPDDVGRSFTLKLADNTTPDSIMQALAASPNHHVRSFALAVPRLNDIFIRVAGGQENNHNHREASREPAQIVANR
jgi:ABC-2 type transport system ATP-binding protein